MDPPRIFGVPAAEAPVVAVIRRGPSGWSHVGRWDLAAGGYEPGAWIRANLYPQRADLSPDGRWLAYLTAKGPGDWAAGPTYVAVSRLPWLSALAAWGTGGTWSRGVHFVATGDHALGPPDEGSFEPRVAGYGLAVTPARAFAVEHRRGWSPAPGSPPRDPESDLWDERRAERLVMQKPSPVDPTRLLSVRGAYGAFRSGPVGECTYALDERPLTDVQWADWGPDGGLVVATRAGRLEVRGPGGEVAAVHDLARMLPQPRPAPRAAHSWAPEA